MGSRIGCFALGLAMAASACAYSQQVQESSGAKAGPSEDDAYCTYLTEQAKAQSDLLRTPNAIGAFTQPDTGLPTQLVGGATLSLSSVKKAGLTLEAARKNCAVYNAQTSVMQTLQYAVPSLEKQALTHRLELIEQASKSLDELIAASSKMVEAQNLTRPMLFELESDKIKLEADQADTQTKIAALYVPVLDAEALKTQVTRKQASDLSEQAVQDRLTRQNNWDVALTVGAHQQIDPVAHGTQPYGEVQVTYNLASRAIDRHLDRSVTAYGDWKKVQASDVVQGMEALRQQIVANIEAQDRRLKSLQMQLDLVAKNLRLVEEPDTTAALDFRNGLSSTQLLLEIESGDASFRLARLREFLAANF
jgi:hypothetical protein